MVGPSFDPSASRISRVALTLVYLGLGAFVALEVAVGAPEPPIMLPPIDESGAGAVIDPIAPLGDSASLVTEILERPLFDPRRRQPAPSLPAPQPAQAAPADVTGPSWRDWRLAGLFVGPDRKEALFVLDAERRSVREGQPIDGWVVSAITAAGVILTGPDGEKRLSPRGQRGRDPVAARPAAAKSDPVAASRSGPAPAPLGSPGSHPTRNAFASAAARNALPQQGGAVQGRLAPVGAR